MSDFGSIIYITKKDKASFSDEEIDVIQKVSTETKKHLGLASSMGDDYKFSVGKTVDTKGNCSTANVLLSDYWGDSEDYKWHKTPEVRDFAKIKAELANRLGEDYEFEASFEWW
ncbi:MAG: hypothetical protein MK212_06335 [Saprospiraceae bacterium]|nr:hypothetical protein [Saprospiraceae bacterium]